MNFPPEKKKKKRISNQREIFAQIHETLPMTNGIFL